MTPLSVLYVDTDRVWRGGQEQIFSLMLGMMKRGHRVILAAPGRAPLSCKAREHGIPTRPFAPRSEFSPLAMIQLLRIFESERPQVVHFNTPRPLLTGGVAARAKRIPVRICSRRVNFPLRSRLSRLKYNWALDCVVTVSVSIRQTLLEGGVSPERVSVIYEGVDLDWIDRQESPPILSEPGCLVVGTVAHLSPEKGHLILLESAAQLVPTHPNLRFVLVGDGQLRESLETRCRSLGIEKQVQFAGFRNNSEALMKRFDIFCLPSLSEGLSSAILAAMANRLPVIATTVGGIPELVVDGETGYLVPPQDPESLTQALRRMLDCPDLRRRAGQSGRRRVETFFTLEQKLLATEKLYLNLLEGPAVN